MWWTVAPGLLALVLSLANLSWTIYSAREKKKADTPRVRIRISEITSAFPTSDGPQNLSYPVVTVQAEKGPIGVSSVLLRFADEEDRRRYNLGTGPAGQSYTQRLAGLGVDVRFAGSTVLGQGWHWDPMNMHVVLGDGAEHKWVFSVQIDRNIDGQLSRVTEGQFRMIAVLIRSDGGDPVESAEFVHWVSWPEPTGLRSGEL